MGAGVSVCNMTKPLDLSPQSNSDRTKGLTPSHYRDLLHTCNAGLCIHPTKMFENKEACAHEREQNASMSVNADIQQKGLYVVRRKICTANFHVYKRQ